MADLKKRNTYAIEMTTVIASGLGMMLLLAASFLMVAYLIVNESRNDNVSIGPNIVATQDSTRFAFIDNVATSAGQVAGVVDDSSTTETRYRNSSAQWFSEIRALQQMTPAYRDGVLDRNAQNQARSIANSCDTSSYSNWSDSLGTRLDEGYVVAFSEAQFGVNSFANMSLELPQKPEDYSRLFTGYLAYGVGVAKVATSAGCDFSYSLVFHLADIN